MSDDRVNEMKHLILDSIERIVVVAEHQGNTRARNGLMAQAASLNTLGERIALHHLPDGFVRSIINDVRLDTLMILTDLKVSLTFAKQEIAAPSKDLRDEARRFRSTDGDDEVAPFDYNTPSRSAHLDRLVSDLGVLTEVEGHLKSCVPLR